ncbi:MAG: succinate dehydrogenase, cytochrome b556 subunit [Bacteroidetes bacterium]|nr:succinate dehydrogenase, cytochrome b556 subunit [Bacteroidota bacterium]
MKELDDGSEDGPVARVKLAEAEHPEGQDIIIRSRVGRPNRNTPWWPANYRAGTWAYALHRLTGLGLVGYLFVHIWVISFSVIRYGSFSFGQVMSLLQSPPFLLLDLGLLAVVLFHGLNGIRIMLFDVGIGVRSQKQLFWLVVAVTLVAVVAAFVFLMGLLFALD